MRADDKRQMDESFSKGSRTEKIVCLQAGQERCQ